MILYTQTSKMSYLWPAPIEPSYQLLGGGDARAIAPKLPHLGMTDVMFLSLIMNLSRERRPWGIVAWMADMFNVSRKGLYDLAARVQERLLVSPAEESSSPVLDTVVSPK